MFLMGLAFSRGSLAESLRRPQAALLAIAMNVIAVPVLASAAACLLPALLGGGLIVVASVPCTLASASLWTRRAGGEVAVSMLVTVITNLFCFLIAPATLLLLLRQSVELDFQHQAAKLALLVVAPLSVAQLLRANRQVASLVTRRIHWLSTVSQLGILSMVLLGMVVTVDRMHQNEASVAPGDVLLMIALAGMIHVAVLWLGWAIAGRLNLPRRQRIAVAISGSQKTLMVGLQIAIDCGVSMIPMIAYHISQLFIDTLIANRWSSENDASESVDR